MTEKISDRKFTLGEKVIVMINDLEKIAYIDWPTIRHSNKGGFRDWFISYPGNGENLFLCRFTDIPSLTHFAGSTERHLVRKAQYIKEKFIKSCQS